VSAGLAVLLVAIAWPELDRWWLQRWSGRLVGQRALGLVLLGS